MSTSGGNPSGDRPVVAGRTYLLTNGTRTPVQASNQEIITAPVFCPYPVPIVGMGVDVTVAGGAGATVQPAVYGLAADGSPGALLIAGPVLNAAAVGTPSGAVDAVVPAGWSWVALLPLAATAPGPTVVCVTGLPGAMFGSPVTVPGVGQDECYPFQTLQAALPAVFAAVGSTSVGPAVWLLT